MSRTPIIRRKNYNGLTSSTTSSLLLGTGVICKNFTVGTDTYSSAKQAGKVISSTRDGVTLTAKYNLEQIVIDGAQGRVKGLTTIVGLDQGSLAATLAEIKKETLMVALGAALNPDSGDDVVTGYDLIKMTTTLAEEDYIDNITYLGCVSGYDLPIIIQLKNCMNEDGLSLKTGDTSSAGLPVTFYANNEIDEFIEDDVDMPILIYFPTAAQSASDSTPASEPAEPTESTEPTEPTEP